MRPPEIASASASGCLGLSRQIPPDYNRIYQRLSSVRTSSACKTPIIRFAPEQARTGQQTDFEIPADILNVYRSQYKGRTLFGITRSVTAQCFANVQPFEMYPKVTGLDGDSFNSDVENRAALGSLRSPL